LSNASFGAPDDTPAALIDKTGENRWPSAGRTHVRQRGISMAASGDFLMAAVRTAMRTSFDRLRRLSSSAGEGFTYEQALYAVNKVY
jgi:hypothetical protein